MDSGWYIPCLPQESCDSLAVAGRQVTSFLGEALPTAPVAFSAVWNAFLHGVSLLSAEFPSAPWTKPNIQSKIFILLPVGRFLVHLGSTRFWASCDGLGRFMTASPCGQHPGSLWALWIHPAASPLIAEALLFSWAQARTEKTQWGNGVKSL